MLEGILKHLNPSALMHGAGSVLREALADPEIRAVLVKAAKDAIASKKQFKGMHWGLEGKPEIVEVDDHDGQPLSELGALVGVAYLTKKGGERKASIYLHQFDTPRPWLYCDGDDLVILRKKSGYSFEDVRDLTSRYKNTSHGIVG